MLDGPSQYTDDDLISFFKLLDSIINRVMRAEGISRPDFSVLRLATTGALEGRPYDLSSLSAASGLSRATVMRRVRTMVARGLLEESWHGPRCMVLPAATTSERLRPLFESLIDMTVAYSHRVEARNGAPP